MNKMTLSILGGVALLGVGVASAAANWDELDPKFYVGGELQAAKSKLHGEYTDKANELANIAGINNIFLKKKHGGFGFLLGVQLNEYAAVEAGYTLYSKAKKSGKGDDGLSWDHKYKPRNMYLDVLAFVPIDGQFKLIGALGVGKLKTKYDLNVKLPAAGAPPGTRKKVQAISDLDKSKIGIRAGIGGQFNFTENWAVRLMVRHQKADKVIKHVNSIALGGLYYF